jgi:hypothetical protein
LIDKLSDKEDFMSNRLKTWVLLTGLALSSCIFKDNDLKTESPVDVSNLDTLPFIPEACTTMNVRVWDKDTVFSWIDWYADGHIDTIFSTTNDWYAGRQSKSFESEFIANGPKNALVCPGDSIWSDKYGYNWKPNGVDTAYFNYSEKSINPKLRPTTHILQKDSILQLFDTLEFTGNALPLFSVSYTISSGDELIALNMDSTVVNLESYSVFRTSSTCGMSPCEYYAQHDSLLICKSSTATIMDGFIRFTYSNNGQPDAEPPMYSFITPLEIRNNIHVDTEPGMYDWTLRIKTRLGYTDSLVGQTVVLDWRDRCQK